MNSSQIYSLPLRIVHVRTKFFRDNFPSLYIWEINLATKIVAKNPVGMRDWPYMDGGECVPYGWVFVTSFVASVPIA